MVLFKNSRQLSLPVCLVTAKKMLIGSFFKLDAWDLRTLSWSLFICGGRGSCFVFTQCDSLIRSPLVLLCTHNHHYHHHHHRRWWQDNLDITVSAAQVRRRPGGPMRQEAVQGSFREMKTEPSGRRPRPPPLPHQRTDLSVQISSRRSAGPLRCHCAA